ncbi:MAG: response regulator [Thermoanaerobaculia bacterium]|nr:response regulator [Thermoanaerobaculia bacterium]
MSATGPTVFVVDDDASWLTAVARLLRASGYRVETFSSASDLLAKLPREPEGCVLADLRMPGLDGLQLQEELERLGSPLPVVFVSGHGDVPATARAFKHGAEDFLTKLAPKEELLEALERALARGGREREERDRIRASRVLWESLTPREREVLAWVLQGRLNKQIAGRLSLNERTVKLHRTNLTRKLGLSSVAELTRWAQEAGLLPELDRLATPRPKGQ